MRVIHAEVEMEVDAHVKTLRQRVRMRCVPYTMAFSSVRLARVGNIVLGERPLCRRDRRDRLVERALLAGATIRSRQDLSR